MRPLLTLRVVIGDYEVEDMLRVVCHACTEACALGTTEDMRPLLTLRVVIGPDYEEIVKACFVRWCASAWYN